MNKGVCAKASLVCLLGLLLTTASCVYVSGCGPQARYEKQVSLSAPLEPGQSFSAETRDGSITIEGVETTECSVLATIRTHAGTVERAEELAEQIEVSLQPSGGGLAVVIDRPARIRNAGYDVSLQVRLPAQTSLALVTSDGSVRMTGVTGTVEARTSDGSIQAENITGDTQLKTSDGSIRCTQIEADTLDLYTSDGSIRLSDATSDTCTLRTTDGSITVTGLETDSLQMRTSDGSIRARDVSAAEVNCHTSDGTLQLECAADAPKAPQVEATTSDGSITFAAPPGLSAVIEAQTNDGSIHTHLPITVEGKVGKHLRGTIGGGEGRIYLRTHDGSITIR